MGVRTGQAAFAAAAAPRGVRPLERRGRAAVKCAASPPPPPPPPPPQPKQPQQRIQPEQEAKRSAANAPPPPPAAAVAAAAAAAADTPLKATTKGTAADSSRLGSAKAAVSSGSRSNATLMQAMGDYFGDDGRELDDYAKRPRNAAGKVMLRVLLIGSGPAEVATARELKKSARARGLYYCPDDDGPEAVAAMEALGTSSTVRAAGSEDEVVHFCKWACVDCVFVGPDRGGCVGQATEAALAAVGITVFQHDVSAAIAAGTMSVDDCLATVSEELDAVAPPAEQLVE